MAIYVKNIATGEITRVNNVRFNDGEIVAEWQCNEPRVDGRFGRNYPFLQRTERTQYHEARRVECRVFTLQEGFELVAKAPRVPSQSQQNNVSATAVAAEPLSTSEPAIANEPANEPVMASPAVSSAYITPIVAPTPSDDDVVIAQKLVSLIRGNMAVPQATINPEDVRAIVREELANVQPRHIEVVTPQGTQKIDGIVCERFEIYCNLVQAGKPLYLYGPAGCGKSYTARQIADALALPYYEVSQALFAHDLKGYGDAGGNYVATPLYKAVTGGGLFFLDEVDASSPEALVVLNNLIANGGFDFPVVGNVKAHPNFRVIAAGNTRMTGATLAYSARQMQDTSFKNRFFFALEGYDERIELQLAGGDTEIVEFAHDLRNAARQLGVLQLISYRQIQDLATLGACCMGDDAYLVRGSVFQEKEVDTLSCLYDRMSDKSNRWVRAMERCIDIMKHEEIW